MLFYPEFALWCGTTATADWHTRYNAACSVYGHLHIPRTTWYRVRTGPLRADGIPADGSVLELDDETGAYRPLT